MTTDDLSFQETVQYVLDSGADKVDIARQFEVAPSTVDRWANGKSAPAPRLRPVYADELMRMVEEKYPCDECGKFVHEDELSILDAGLYCHTCMKPEKCDWKLFKWKGGRGCCRTTDDPWEVFNLDRTVTLEHTATAHNTTEDKARGILKVLNL